MIHQYKNNGYNIVMDVCSGAIHVVDDVTYDVIALYEEKNLEEIKKELSDTYNKEEIEEAYEKNTGVLIADEFERRGKDYTAVPAVLCKNHGPFTWGKDAAEAVHNAVVLEEVAKMATKTELINPKVQPAPDSIRDKHFFRKHGENAYYGQ